MRTIEKITRGLILVTLLSCVTLGFSQNYWVGGQGKWSDDNHWSKTSGGLAGATIPTSNQDVVFDGNSGIHLGDTVFVDVFAYAKNINFSLLPFPMNFKGKESVGIYMNGKILGENKFINQFNGLVHMDGSESGYQHKIFSPREFYGKQSFVDVYANITTNFQTLSIPSVDTVITNSSCGASNGSIVVKTITGGGGPYGFQWYPAAVDGNNTDSIYNLPAGIYTCVITDSSDLSIFRLRNLSISGTQPLYIYGQPDSAKCKGSSDGSIQATINEGNQPYTYIWSDVTAQNNMSVVSTDTYHQEVSVDNLPAGNYNLTIVDSEGCTDSVPGGWEVREPTLLTSPITSAEDVLCFSECTGEAIVTPNGGTPGYLYDWYDAPGSQTTAGAIDLCESTYHVKVTDGKGCLDTAEVFIGQPDSLIASIAQSNDETCFGSGDGAASALVSGGAYPYRFNWYSKDGDTDSAATGFVRGDFTVLVTDTNNCLDSAQVTIGGPDEVDFTTIEIKDVLCKGESTGEVEILAQGGTPGYTYLWYNASNQNTPKISNLTEGIYYAKIKDGRGCLDTAEIKIDEPLSALSSMISDTTHNLCYQDCEGSAIVLASGGTPDYSYEWYYASVIVENSTITGLCVGDYNVRVTDGNGCTNESSVSIREPNELTGTSVVTDLQCNGVCEGSIDLSPEGGSPSYSFKWYDVSDIPVTEDVDSLCQGTYHVKITDDNLCLDTIEFEISQPEPVTATLGVLTDILCHGDSTGSASVSGSGGSGSFNYEWSVAHSDSTLSFISGIPSGSYNVRVYDANSCSDTAGFDINQPASPITSSIQDVVNVSCKNDCSGQANVIALGGTPSYTYRWYDLPEEETNSDISDLCDGIYNVEVSDDNGCKDTSTLTINEPANEINTVINDSVNVTCNGECDGKALVTYSGGTGVLFIDWLTPENQKTDTAFNLCAGLKMVKVEDENGCKDTAKVFIEEPSPLVVGINPSVKPTCFGDCDGYMSVTPSGGTGPYSYNWYDADKAPSTSFAPDQCSGDYHVVVQDSLSCEVTTLINLEEPDVLDYSLDSKTDVLCRNICTGEISISPIGGTSPYQVTWYSIDGSPQGEGVSVSELCADTWKFKTKDANMCLDTGTVTITEPLTEVSSSITDNVHNLCFGDCNGSAQAQASGGTGDKSFHWYNSDNNDSASLAQNFCAGTFYVKVEDENGCSDTSEITIDEPENIVIVTNKNITDCGNLDTSSASVSVFGGEAPYTYDWYDAGNRSNDTIFNLSSGTYHCKVTDSNLCVNTAEITINAPDPVIASIRGDTIHNSCFGECLGMAVADRSGGTFPYTYDWYDASGTPKVRIAQNLCAGVYHVEVQDDKLCKDTAEFVIRQPSELIASAGVKEVICSGRCNGVAWTDYSGGTPSYSVVWNTIPNTTTDTIKDICPGTYTVRVEDSNGCKDTAYAIVTEPDELVSEIADTTHLLCYADCGGQAIVEPSGGVSPYGYKWLSIEDNDSIGDNLCIGYHSVQITDANGCLDTSDLVITSSSSEIVSNTDSTVVSCYGLSDGQAIVSGVGGESPYSYDWFNNGNITNNILSELKAGAYFVEVKDNLGCSDTAIIQVTEPDSLIAENGVVTDVLCFSESTGDATVEVSGGTPSYLYSWYNAPGGGTSSTKTNLPTGTYIVGVMDSKGCKDTTIVFVDESSEMILASDSIPTLCSGNCNGSAIVIPSGGAGSYSYDWYDIVQTADTAIGLCAGIYSVKVTDLNSCVSTLEVEVTEPTTIVASAIDSTAATCNGGSDGSAVVVGLGGTEPYSYLWDAAAGNQAVATAVGLKSGSYKAAVTDVNGCHDTVEVFINQPDTIAPNDSIQNVSCAGLYDGTITLNVTGGTKGAEYVHSWSVLSTDTFAINLRAGTYSDTITDGAGCIDTFSFVVNEPDTLESMISDTTHVLCFGDSTGIATVKVLGGTSPYTYRWYDAPQVVTDSTITDLPSGAYNVEITDSNGCSDTSVVVIREPSEMILASDSTQATCSGICTGSAIVIPSGGAGSYSYDWYDIVQTTDTAIGLCAGIYSVKVTDLNSCVSTLEVEVTEPVTVSAFPIDSMATTCNGGSDGWAAVGGLGGTEPYSYWWDDDFNQMTDTAVGLKSGLYKAAVTDLNGCNDTIEITISQPDTIAPNDSIVNISCAGLCDATITLNVTGGTEGAGYIHSWSSGSVGIIATDLCVGTHTDTIIDGAGCIDTLSFVVTQPDTLETFISDTTHLKCFGDSNGVAVVAPSGGTSPYTYEWYDVPGGITDSTVTGLPSGTFHVNVMDSNGCSDTSVVTIREPTEIILASDSVPATCTGICTGAAIVTPSGGVGGYAYNWFDAEDQTTDTASGLCAGIYSVKVTDLNSCVSTLEVEVTEPVTVSAFPIDSMATTCNGGSDGWAAVGGLGGTEPYSYWWDDDLNQMTDTAVGLKSGLYKAAVTDLNGCNDTIEITISQPDTIAPNDSIVNISCAGLCDATITLNVTGGTEGAGYIHSWSSGSVGIIATDLCVGTHTDTITDGVGCMDTFSFVIAEPDTLEALFSSTIDVVCSSKSNGQAIVTPEGGTPIYSYDWYDVPGGDEDSVASGLLPGTYHVEVTDANGCIDSGEVVINSPDPLELTPDSVPSTCSGICDGIAIVHVTGGITPYTYNWFGYETMNKDSIYDVCAETYSVTVSDSNGCEETINVFVSQPVTVFSSILDSTEVTCYGGSDGWAVVGGSGGTEPYSYWWDDELNQKSDTAVDLETGIYKAAVTDVNGCSDTVQVSIDTPLDWAHVKDSTRATCYSYCDAQITLTPVGGVGPYNHNWNTGSNSPAIINLCEGVYTDTIMDSKGCLDTVSIVITQPDSLEVTPVLVKNVVCYGQNSAMAYATGKGGTSPYTFEWGSPVITTNDTLYSAVADTYSIVLRDSLGCVDANSIVLSQPDTLTSFISDTLHANCVCNASATVTSMGGMIPYDYKWNDVFNTTDSVAENLCTGDYFVEVIDANGCLDTSFVTIRDTSVFTISLTDTNHVSCDGLCDGSAVVTPKQGTFPYTYLWSDSAGSSDSSVTSLCAGPINVTVTDDVGCIRFASLNIGQPNGLLIVSDYIEPLCNGDSNGVAWVNVSGGSKPYNHSWNSQSTNDTLFNITAGVYVDTIVDANGCIDTVSVNVKEPDVLVSNMDSINIKCFGSSNGSAWVEISGGTEPYNYLWDDSLASSSDSLNTLDAGVYTVTINDFKGCSLLDSVNIIQPDLLTSNISDTSHVACFCSGTATVTSNGGTSPISYLWNDPSNQNDSAAINLCAGSYEVSLTDANGCLDTSYVNIRDTSGFVTSIADSTMVGCYGECNGKAVAMAENGVQPYDFIWDDPAITNDSLVTGLCAGTYTVTISDALGCTHIQNVTITQSDLLVTTILDTNVSCNGACDGSVRVDVAGGVSPYLYQWNNESVFTDEYIDSLCVGQYILEVTDSNGCSKNDTVYLLEPPEITAFINPYNHISCFGENDASLTAMPTGGVSPYTYLWNDGDTTNIISEKGPGTYSLIITDSLNCSDDTSVIILEPVKLSTSINDTNHLICRSIPSGSAVVTPSEGTKPYSYDWYDAPGSQTDSTASNLFAGTYHVEVIDANGCSDTAQVTITAPSLFSVSIDSLTSTSCDVCDGTAIATPTGGVGPYNYNWYDAPNNTADSLVVDLCASQYKVSVSDANGCLDTAEVTIEGPAGFTVKVVDTTMVTCNALSDGSAVVVAEGGEAPYIFLWDDSLSTENDSIEGLAMGVYNVVVSDENGCNALASVSITQPEALEALINTTTSTACSTPCSGEATVVVTGGTSPYLYQWDDLSAQTSTTASSLCAAQYSVVVSDKNGCEDSVVTLITGPADLTVSIDSIQNVSCNAECDGSVAITPTGGVGEYSYIWNDPSATEDTLVTNLCAGEYNAQITDENGCLAFANVSIVEPDELVVFVADSSDIVCNGDSSGWALVGISGGTSPYSIEWNDNSLQETDTASGLGAGTYTVKVTDANGCFNTAFVTLIQPDPITSTVSDVEPVLCTGFCLGKATLVVSGGTEGSGYTYLWENGKDSITGTELCSGEQSYTITDSVGCNLVGYVEIIDENNFEAIFSGSSVECNGDCNGTILVKPSGGISPYRHSWNNGSVVDSLTALCPGIYIDTVFDDHGCFMVDSFKIEEPETFVLSMIDSSNLSCFGICDGKAIVQGTGGTAPYSYDWYNAPDSQVNDTAINLCAETYFVRGEDENGCASEDTISLSQPSQVVVSLDSSNDITCNGLCNGIAGLSAVGGTGSVSFLWEDADTLNSRTDLCPGNYRVYAIDDTSCIDSISFLINQPDSLTAFITDTTHIICAEVCDGAAKAGQAGGTSPFIYNWYNATGSIGSDQITGQCAGDYAVEVTDLNGCVDTARVEINDVNLLKVSLIPSHISCKGKCDGSLTAQPSGGIGPYTFLWNDSSTLDSIIELCSDNYFVTITDDKGCQTSAGGNIIEPSSLTSSIVDSANLDCFGICDGYATVSPSGGTGPYTYLWNNSNSDSSFTASGLCAKPYKVIVTDNRGCLDSTITNLEQPDSIEIMMVENKTNCTNSSDGSIEISPKGGVGDYSYIWTGVNDFSSSSKDIQDLPLGKYAVTVLDQNGCSVNDTAIITEVNIIKANAGKDVTICEADSILLIGSGGTLYSWSDGGTTKEYKVSPLITTTYILNVFNNGCSDKDSVIVSVNELPEITASANDYLILNGTSAQLQASGAGINGLYDWEPPIGLNDPTIENPVSSISEGTTYIVKGTDENGCFDTASVHIDVASTIVYSDGITPNGDGLNDTWRIKLINEFPNATVHIYNRWGQKVFQSSGYQNEWDGTSNNKDLPVGTYYYLIDLGPNMKKHTGPVTIMR